MSWYGTTLAGERAKAAVKAKRRARRVAAAPRVDGEEVTLDAIFARDRVRGCCLCKLPVTRKQASVEHKVPLSAGGAHTLENCQLAHKRCNSKKGARTVPRRKGLRRTPFRRKPKPKPPAEEGMF